MWGERVLPFIVETQLFDLDYPEDIEPVVAALGKSEHDIQLLVGPPKRHPV